MLKVEKNMRKKNSFDFIFVTGFQHILMEKS